MFLYLPTGVEILNRADAASEREAFLQDHCGLRDVTCASARRDFSEAAASGATFSTEGHWGPAGRRASAIALAKLLRAAGLATTSRVESADSSDSSK